MSLYLTREELAQACECAATSYRTMERRLTAMGWPHQPRPGACPLVLRSVHDAILAGQQPAAAARARPNFAALEG